MKPRVFVVQNQTKASRAGAFVPKFNLSPAQEFGEIVFCLPPGLQPFDNEKVIDQLHKALSDFTSDDYLVLTGNPILIGWTVAIAAMITQGHLNMLQWDSQHQIYRLIKSDLKMFSVH
jgi:hypothetical protein